jgi:hypothetical protein
MSIIIMILSANNDILPRNNRYCCSTETSLVILIINVIRHYGLGEVMGWVFIALVIVCIKCCCTTHILTHRRKRSSRCTAQLMECTYHTRVSGNALFRCSGKNTVHRRETVGYRFEHSDSNRIQNKICRVLFKKGSITMVSWSKSVVHQYQLPQKCNI